MKTVILAGGKGSRFGEAARKRPKPLMPIGGKPVLWHIMKHYGSYGFNDFVICGGYKQNMLKDFFADYFNESCDVTFDFTEGGANGRTVSTHAEPWRVTIADTGLETKTAGRIRRIRDYVNDEPFLLTYGDGVSDVDLNELIRFHEEAGGVVTLTGVDIEQRFGVLDVTPDGRVSEFREKYTDDSTIINSGFMVVEPTIFDEPLRDDEDFSAVTLHDLAAKGKLTAYRHSGFWHPMDTPQDRAELESLWDAGDPPWKTWQ